MQFSLGVGSCDCILLNNQDLFLGIFLHKDTKQKRQQQRDSMSSNKSTFRCNKWCYNGP